MWFDLITGVWLFAVSIMDIRSRKVPVWTLVMGGVLTSAACICQKNGYPDIARGMLPGIFLLLTAFVTGKAGYGDGVVLLFLGMTAGAGESFIIFGISLFLAALFSVLLLALRKAGRNTGIPFLPFLTAAWLIVML